MILEVFIDFFGVKITVGWSKNIFNLIIAVGFNFGANMTVKIFFKPFRSIHNHWIKLGFKIWSFGYIFDIFRYITDISRYIFDIFTDISDISPIFYRYF